MLLMLMRCGRVSANVFLFLVILRNVCSYGLFYAYRQYANPRAKLSDLFFILGALVVFGNIFSILVFKKRIY